MRVLLALGFCACAGSVPPSGRGSHTKHSQPQAVKLRGLVPPARQLEPGGLTDTDNTDTPPAKDPWSTLRGRLMDIRGFGNQLSEDELHVLDGMVPPKRQGRELVKHIIRGVEEELGGTRPVQVLDLGLPFGGSIEDWLSVSDNVRVVALDSGVWNQHKRHQFKSRTVNAAAVSGGRQLADGILQKVQSQHQFQNALLQKLGPDREQRVAVVLKKLEPGLKTLSSQGFQPDVIYWDHPQAYKWMTARNYCQQTLQLLQRTFPNAVTTGDDYVTGSDQTHPFDPVKEAVTHLASSLAHGGSAGYTVAVAAGSTFALGPQLKMDHYLNGFEGRDRLHLSTKFFRGKQRPSSRTHKHSTSVGKAAPLAPPRSSLDKKYMFHEDAPFNNVLDASASAVATGSRDEKSDEQSDTQMH